MTDLELELAQAESVMVGLGGFAIGDKVWWTLNGSTLKAKAGIVVSSEIHGYDYAVQMLDDEGVPVAVFTEELSLRHE